MDMSMNLIPIVLFLSIAGSTCYALFVAMRNRQAQHETLRHAIQNGQQLDARTLALLAKPVNAPEADLRGGIINLAVGLGLALVGVVARMSNFETNFAQVAWFAAIFMACLGVGQMLAYRARAALAGREAADGQDARG
jgi:hypothetical protein